MSNREKAHALVSLGCTLVPFEVLPNGKKRPAGGLQWSKVIINTPELVDAYWYAARDPQPLVAWYHPTKGAIDMDVKHGKDGWLSLEVHELALPDTPVFYDTPSGGQHLIYEFPAGTTETVDIKYKGFTLDGVDRRVANGLAIWYGDVPSEEDWNAVPKAPEWSYAFEEVKVDAPIVKTPQEWFDSLPKGEIAPEIRKILDFVIPGQINHNTMRDTQYAIVAEGAKGATGALEALAEFKALYLSGKYDTAEYESVWSNGPMGLIAKVPEFQQKANAATPDNFEKAVLDKKFNLQVEREAKKRIRQETQGRPEFWDWEDLENVVLDWQIEGLWYKGSLNGLVGRSQIGKTFVMVGMCGAVATGTEFMGLKAQQGRVLYVAGEGKSGITKRFRDWCEKSGQDWEAVKQNIDIVTSVDTLNEGHIEDLVARNAERAYSMVIFDTLSATSSIENENDSADMWEVMHNGKKIAPDAVTIFVHHPSEATKNLANPKARGASAFYNDADNIVTITVDRSFEPYGTVPEYSNGDTPLFLTMSTNFEDHGGKSKESEPVTIRGLFLSEYKRGHIAIDSVKGGYKDPDQDKLKKICDYLEAAGTPITRKTFYQGFYDLARQNKWEPAVKRTTDRIVEKAVSLSWLEEISASKGNNGAVYERPKMPDLSYLTNVKNLGHA
jgi:hypothetical protein